MDRKNLVRQPAVAGTFYPGEKNELKNIVLEMLAYSSSEQFDGRVVGIISPHAGYIYSGRIAAKAYKQIQSKKYDNVIVIATSHFEYFDGCSIYFGDYQTPLGIVSTNIEIADSIVSRSQAVVNSSRGHFREHSLEVQIPFLQACLRDFKLIPVLMGKQDYLMAKELSNVICTVLSDPGYEDQSTLIVGSSDLSHYYPAKIAKEMDGIVINDIEEFDERRLFEDVEAKICEACGYGAMMSTMMIAKALGATESKVLSYGTSGETTQDYSSVVGYVSAIFYY
ncbi:MAG: AmmeMemoRadiSam system protein B [Thermodesulfobacteriota bacterium]